MKFKFNKGIFKGAVGATKKLANEMMNLADDPDMQKIHKAFTQCIDSRLSGAPLNTWATMANQMVFRRQLDDYLCTVVLSNNGVQEGEQQSVLLETRTYCIKKMGNIIFAMEDLMVIPVGSGIPNVSSFDVINRGSLASLDQLMQLHAIVHPEETPAE